MTDSAPAPRTCAVIGGGPAGLIAALALAHYGVPAALVARRPTQIDNRTTALLAGSVAALWGRAAATSGLVHIDSAAQSIAIEASGVTVIPADGAPLRTQLVVGADGRQSLCRAAAGIAMEERSYPQTALTYVLSHSRPHHDISTEFHTEDGPFTVVPLPGLRSSLVCVVAPAEAESLAGLSGAALDAEIERRCHSILGKVQVEPGRGVFPLVVATASRPASGRVALVGEAAHVFPPIGAQGLNLGLRDAVTIAEVAGNAFHAGGDIGADGVTTEYERRRRPDIASRTLAIDILNRSLLCGFLPFQGLRGLGLYALDRIGPLRRAVMREGIAPSAATPLLMHREA